LLDDLLCRNAQLRQQAEAERQRAEDAQRRLDELRRVLDQTAADFDHLKGKRTVLPAAGADPRAARNPILTDSSAQPVTNAGRRTTRPAAGLRVTPTRSGHGAGPRQGGWPQQEGTAAAVPR
jgi:hypothetical protein